MKFKTCFFISEWTDILMSIIKHLLVWLYFIHHFFLQVLIYASCVIMGSYFIWQLSSVTACCFCVMHVGCWVSGLL